MPIHNWARVDAGIFHDFHQGWTVELKRALNGGVLPRGFFAMIAEPEVGPEPDVIAGDSQAGPSFAEAQRDRAAYSRRANRITVHRSLNQVVATVKLVSPGDKDSRGSVASFVNRAVGFLSNGIHMLVVDLFPPTASGPNWIHQPIWQSLVGESGGPGPAGKPITIASYVAGHPPTAYVDPVAVGDVLPDTPLFLTPDRYIPIPLEATYMASWVITPGPIRELVEGPTGR